MCSYAAVIAIKCDLVGRRADETEISIKLR